MSLLLLFAPSDGPGPPIVPTASDPDDSHVFLAWNNLVDGAILSGGAYVPSLPLNNLKNRVLQRVARSADLLPTSTQFDIDLGPDKLWRVLALPNHNFNLDARYRVRASATQTHTSPIHDSGWLDVWPAVYDETELEWDDLNWWEGTYTEAERQGYVWTLIHKLATTTDARYVRVEIQDLTNPSGYAQMGRAFVANGWTPTHNMEVGASLGWEDPSEVQEAYGGAEYFNERPRYRVAKFTIQAIEISEAYGKAFEIMRQAGITKEVLIQWNPADAKNAIRQSFVGRLRQLSPIEHPYPIQASAAFEIKENQK